jgi:hypothetical protein
MQLQSELNHARPLGVGESAELGRPKSACWPSGGRKFTLFSMLKNSARNSMRFDSRMGMFCSTEKSHTASFGPRSSGSVRDTLPNVYFGGLEKAATLNHWFTRSLSLPDVALESPVHPCRCSPPRELVVLATDRTAAIYRINSYNTGRESRDKGMALANDGLRVELPETETSEILHVHLDA